MTLRLRLLLGYGYLVALLLLAAGSSMLGFLYLSASIEIVLEENLASIGSAMTMIDALERQDSATLAGLLERGEGEDGDLPLLDTAFEQALDEASTNVTEEGESEILAQIRGEFARYRQARDGLLGTQPPSPLAAYNREVFPRFAAVKGAVIDLLALNQQAMFDADRDARQRAVQNGTWLGFLVVIGLVSLVFLSRAMQRRILRPIDRLVRGIDALGTGHRRLHEEGDGDEITRISRQVNRLLDRLDELRSQSQGRLAYERRIVQGLVASEAGIALYSPVGDLLAGEPLPAGLGERIAAWIGEEGRRRVEAVDREAVVVEAGGEAAELTLVVAPGERPVAWLVRRRSPQ